MAHDLKLEWRNINYAVPKSETTNYTFWKNFRKPKEIKILSDVNGQMNTGDLVAVLGCSGSGKTSMLAAISQRLRGNLTGDVLLNGVVVDRNQMIQLSSFLPQYDINVRTFTAYEHLYFMSHFKMHRETTRYQRRHQVNELLMAVGLFESSNTQIQQLSGGERKRLSLAEELLTDPPILFCDEPTTGLDSYSAYSVIKTLRELCSRQRIMEKSLILSNGGSDNNTKDTTSIELEILSTKDDPKDSTTDPQLSNGVNYFIGDKQKKAIICSIHQPTSDIFELFTHIILMSAGRVIYQGSTERALEFFKTIGYPVPKNCNPADFYLKIVHDPQKAKLARLKYEHEIDGMHSGSWLNEKSNGRLPNLKNFAKICWIYQVYFILNRFFIENMRNKKFFLIKLGFFMITSVTCAIIYSGMNEFSQTSVQDVSGSMFVLTSEVIFTLSYSVLYVFPSSLPILRRDVGEGTYSLSAYFVAVILSYIPMAFIKSYMFLSVIYGTLFFARGFMLYLSMGLVLSISSITATGYGIFLSSMFETDKMASEFAAPFDLLFLMFAGVYYNVDSIPLLKYISLFFFANEALMYDFWIDVDHIACSKNVEHPCLSNGIEVLKQASFRYSDDTMWLDCSGLLILALIFNSMAYLFIRKYVKRTGYY